MTTSPLNLAGPGVLERIRMDRYMSPQFHSPKYPEAAFPGYSLLAVQHFLASPFTFFFFQ
jgi:hypothetical protein